VCDQCVFLLNPFRIICNSCRRFPKARVWPPLPISAHPKSESDLAVTLPPKEVQEHLLDLYFTYVHPFLPIIHKQSFLEAFREEYVPRNVILEWSLSISYFRRTHRHAASHSDASSDPLNASGFGGRRRGITSLLLLSMFSFASRYDPNISYPSDPSTMWSAGDEYLESAKVLLNSTYASSKPSTVQALLLMGYREGGIGDMSLAWTYIGMGIRMAQDLGMHRFADGWKRGELGGRLFTEWELAERRRIWFGCVVLEKFISAIIGRSISPFVEKACSHRVVPRSTDHGF